MKKFPRDVLGKISWLRCVVWLPVLCLTVVGSATAQPSPAPPKVGYTVSGRGLFLLDFDYATGRVTDVHVLKSTGNATYDAITLSTGTASHAHTLT